MTPLIDDPTVLRSGAQIICAHAGGEAEPIPIEGDDMENRKGTPEQPIVATSLEPSEADKARGPVDLSDDPEARLYTSAPLEAEDGTIYVIQQQPVGPDNELGGGEFPDPETPPHPPAPGAA
jgi:hypothetical protein